MHRALHIKSNLLKQFSGQHGQTKCMSLIKQNDTCSILIKSWVSVLKSTLLFLYDCSSSANSVTEKTYFIFSAASTKVSSLQLLFTVTLILSVTQASLSSGWQMVKPISYKDWHVFSGWLLTVHKKNQSINHTHPKP